jgi:hypothetical protein
MDGQVVEGTWEEVIQNGAWLAGKRVRVTVLDPGPPVDLEKTLEALLAEADRLDPAPKPLVSESEAWGRDVAEKFRRQGFDT